VNPYKRRARSDLGGQLYLDGLRTGAIMSVPAHDERDFEFARKYNLKIRTVIVRPQPVDPEDQRRTGAPVHYAEWQADKFRPI